MSSERPTVVVAIKGLGIGGAEKLIAEGARYWDRTRFDYRVAYALPWKNQLVATLEDIGIPVVCFGSKRGMTPASVARFRRIVREADAALVHAHLPAMGAAARLVSPVPVVYTEHNLAHSYRRPVQIANRSTYSRNAAVMAVSDAVGESIASYPARRRQVIPNGVAIPPDIDTTGVRSELGLRDNDRLVVHVGNIRPLKGHRNLVAAATLLDRDHVLIVSIGGEKTEGDLEEIRSFAADRQAAERIRFLGRREDAIRFMAAADIYVNPADVEGLPVSILEALALSRPVVATAVGGVPSIVRDAETGLLVPPGDPAALAAAIERLLDNPEYAEKLGQAGSELVAADYSLEAMVRATEEVYAEVLDG
ncbi:MAG: glycosyltransferase [Acidimicrobiia bacterium]|nr:glycosyltransferase [Acidimicrobiia bacterium]